MSKDELIGRAREMWDLFVSAMVCLYEAIVGKELSCPPCWKCTSMRWMLAAILAATLYGVMGGWFILVVILLVLYLVSFGQGMWVAVREAIARYRGMK